MSLAGTGPVSLAQIDRAALPAAVRDGSAERRERYAAALGFERQLLGQLTQQLAGGSLAGEGSSAATDALRDQLPAILADGLIAAGGIGIAAQLDTSWESGAVHTSLGDAAGDSVDGDAGTGAGGVAA